jgi:hypothetical protein
MTLQRLLHEMAETAHAVLPLPTYRAGELRTEPVPPVTYRLMADVDPALEQQVFHVPP